MGFGASYSGPNERRSWLVYTLGQIVDSESFLKLFVSLFSFPTTDLHIHMYTHAHCKLLGISLLLPHFLLFRDSPWRTASCFEPCSFSISLPLYSNQPASATRHALMQCERATEKLIHTSFIGKIHLLPSLKITVDPGIWEFNSLVLRKFLVYINSDET